MSGKKKSASQIARMKKRAEARGEVYEAPVYDHVDTTLTNDDDDDTEDHVNRKKLSAAIKLYKQLDRIEKDEELKSKERRSAKRKAEAIAVEESGCTSLEDLTSWYEKEQQKAPKKDELDANGGESDGKLKKANPYIAFVGQLSYETTKQQLFDHIQTELSSEFKVTDDSIQIRLLTDPKTKKSRGMAFVEITSDPELLYGLLKLHKTHLNGRRINVERSAGGRKDSDSRKQKLQSYRKEQAEFISEQVVKMIEAHKKTGELQESELDEGAIELCKRHSAHVVEGALTRYLETNGRDMDNPSAYFTHLIGKIATEGAFEGRGGDNKPKNNGKSAPFSKRKRQDQPSESENGLMGNKMLKSSSEFSKRGVDMSISEGDNSLAKVFPSMNRGRGRSGRGYMY